MMPHDDSNDTLSSKQTPYYIVYKPIHALGLSGNEFAVYCSLLYFANNDTSVAFPSYKTIAEIANVSVKTAQRAIPELEAKGLVSVERQYNADTKRYSSNHYTLLPVPSDNLTPPSDNLTLGVASQSPRNKNNIEQDKKNKLTRKKREPDIVFDAILLGSFGLKPEDDHIPGARVGRIKKAVKEAYPNLDDIGLKAMLEAAYVLYAKTFPDVRTNPARRLKDPAKIVDWMGMARRDVLPDVDTIKAAVDWTPFHEAFAMLAGGHDKAVQQVSQLDVQTVQQNLRSRLSDNDAAKQIKAVLSTEQIRELQNG